MLSNNKIKISLRFVLIFFIALIIVISSLFVISLNWNHSINESRKNIIEIQKIQSKEIQKYLKHNFTSIEKSVSLITDLIEHSHIDFKDIDQIKTILVKIALQEEMMSTLSFADLNDNYISVFRTNNDKKLLFAHADKTGQLNSDYVNPTKAYSDQRITQGFFASTRFWFTQAINSLEIEWHPIYEYYSSGNYGMGASKVVLKDNQAIGVVAIDYTLNDLSNLLISLKQDKPGVLLFMDKSNKIIASNIKNKEHNNQELYKKIQANNFSIVQNLIKNSNKTSIKKGLIIRTSKIFLNHQNEYYLIDIVSEEKLLNAISKKASKQMWVAILIVSITLIVFYFVLLYIFKPIKNLEQASKKIYLGEWDINLPNSRFTEISNLSSAYGAMADKIHKFVQTLENKVKERTEKLNQSNKQLNKMILTDPLTGLGNRRYYNKVMDELWSDKIKLSLAIIDIDFFKLYNDTYGHVSGDECLKKIGLLFKPYSQEKNIQFFRIGGEEFAIVFSETSFNEVLENLDELMKTLALLEIEHISSKINKYITLSIGVKERCSSHKNWNDLYKESDLSLYKAKQEGRNRIYTHTNLNQ